MSARDPLGAHPPASREAAVELGALFEAHGWPRIVGRVLGELLLADPPYLSTAELCEQIPTSKGHLSSAISYLTAMRMVQRFGVPGSRKDHYRLTPDAFVRAMASSAEPMLRLADYADRALEHCPPGTAAYQQAHRMREFYRYFARRVPDLMTDFEAQYERPASS